MKIKYLYNISSKFMEMLYFVKFQYKVYGNEIFCIISVQSLCKWNILYNFSSKLMLMKYFV